MRVRLFVARPVVRRAAVFALAASTLVGLSGCRDLISRSRRAESITLSPSSFELPVNASRLIVGTAFDKDNNTIASKTIRYSSANGAVATVTGDGTVIGVAPGQTIISGEADGARGEAVVTVVPEVPGSITVTPSPVTLRRGNVRQFTASPRNASGAPITGLTVSWSSSNSAVASVTQSGQVTAVAAGTATINAAVGQVVGSSQVTVTEVPIGSIALSPLTKGLRVDESFIPDITLRDTAENVITSLGRPLNWTSSNELNASVSATGVVTGRRAGTARITAASPDNQAINSSMDVTVTDRVVATVIITPRTGALRLGLPRLLSAQLLDSLNQPITGRVVTWTSLTPTIASVSINGNVTGISLGTARISARVGEVADTVQFPVTRIPVGEIVLTPTQATVIQGQTAAFSAIVRDSVGTEVDDRTIDWLSSVPAVATVSNTGVVTGVNPGTTIITARAENRSETSLVTVLQVPVDSVNLVNAFDSVVAVNTNAPGNVQQVQIELLDAAGGTVLNRSLLITSTNPNRATAVWNPSTRVLTITGGTSPGETIISLRALSGTGSPEGKTTRIRVTVTATTPP